MNPQCEHTLYHADRQGRLQGSWAEELVVDPHLGQRVRIACAPCGKFYGYLRDGARQTTTPSLPAGIEDARGTSPQTPEPPTPRHYAEPKAVNPKPPKPNKELRRQGIDYKKLRQLVSMGDVLELIEYQPTSTHGDQVRGPCPVHGSTSKRSRSLSVDLRGGRFQCFKPCGAKGNQLDLWVALAKMPLYEASLDLCVKMNIEVPWAT